MPHDHKSVSGLYDRISAYYELANSFLTFGFDLYWRYKASLLLRNLKPGKIKILDVCCGTGDFSLRLMKTYNGEAEIIGTDLNEKMIAKAAARTKNITFILSDSADLPFPDESFDAVSISFATRNIAVKKRDFMDFLREFRRVLKKDGVFLNLETTKPKNPLLASLMAFYVKASIGFLNLINPEGKPSYSFLRNSILNFYSAEELSALLAEAGFSRPGFKIFCPGAVAAHTGWK